MMIIPVPEMASCHLIRYLRFYFIKLEMTPNLKKYVKLLVSVSSSLGCFHHYLSSVILYFTFESFPLKPLRQMNQNLVCTINGRSASFLSKNMLVVSNACFWLDDILKIFSTETRRHNEFYYIGGSEQHFRISFQ
jgi:hypothetical protein